MKRLIRDRMKLKVVTLLALIIIPLITPQLVSASPLELPPDLVEKLHTDLKVAFLYEKYYWTTGYERPLPIKYYTITKIKLGDLYYLNRFDVLVLYSEPSGTLTTEQMNAIVKFVEGGGGLIIGYSYHVPDWVRILLQKFGIYVLETRKIRDFVIVEKDGIMMLDHPITTGVEKIRVMFGGPVTRIRLEGGGKIFIKEPFIAVAKNYGSGRVVFIGAGGELKGGGVILGGGIARTVMEELSGLRLGVNCVEWVAGYTPPGWEPKVYSKVARLENENAKLKETLSTLESLNQELKNKLSTLESEYNSLKAKFEKLKSDYEDLKSKYEAKTSPTYTITRTKTITQPTTITQTPSVQAIAIWLLVAGLIIGFVAGFTIGRRRTK